MLSDYSRWTKWLKYLTTKWLYCKRFKVINPIFIKHYFHVKFQSLYNWHTSWISSSVIKLASLPPPPPTHTHMHTHTHTDLLHCVCDSQLDHRWWWSDVSLKCRTSYLHQLWYDNDELVLRDYSTTTQWYTCDLSYIQKLKFLIMDFHSSQNIKRSLNGAISQFISECKVCEEVPLHIIVGCTDVVVPPNGSLHAWCVVWCECLWNKCICSVDTGLNH